MPVEMYSRTHFNYNGNTYIGQAKGCIKRDGVFKQMLVCLAIIHEDSIFMGL
jgi:hypothetical protein